MKNTNLIIIIEKHNNTKDYYESKKEITRLSCFRI